MTQQIKIIKKRMSNIMKAWHGIGLVSLSGSLYVQAIIFMGIFLRGQIIAYEFDKNIISTELVFLAISIMYLLYLFSRWLRTFIR